MADKWRWLRKKLSRSKWDDKPDGFINLLPDNLCYNILALLPLKDLCNATMVSTKWRHLATDDQLWKPLYKRRWRVRLTHPECWMEEYARQFQRVHKDWVHGKPTQRIIPLGQPARAMRFDDDKAIISQGVDVIQISLKADNDASSNRMEGAPQLPSVIWRGHTGPVTCLQYDERTLVSGSEDGSLKVWPLKPEKDADNVITEPRINIRPDPGLEGQCGISSLRFDDAVIACGRMNGFVDVWDIEENRASIRMQTGQGAITELQFDAERLVTGSLDGTIKQFDLRTGRDAVLTITTGGPVLGFQYQFDTIMVGCADGTIGIWDLRTTKELGRLAAYDCSSGRCARTAITTLCFDDCSVLAGTAGGVIHVWERKQQQQQQQGGGGEGVVMQQQPKREEKTTKERVELIAGNGSRGGVSNCHLDLATGRLVAATHDEAALYVYDFDISGIKQSEMVV